MPSCFRISEAAALALHTAGMLADSADAVVSTPAFAAQLSVSENHLAKVHQRLTHAGITAAVRGPSGGFRLAKPASAIRLIEIVEAVDGPLEPSQCLLGRPTCLRANCLLGGLSDSINAQVLDFLNSTTVADLGAAGKLDGA